MIRAVLAGLAAVLDPVADGMVGASLPALRFIAERLGITTPLLLSSALGLERRYAEMFPEQPGPTHRIIAFLNRYGSAAK
jgi:hypothetical protein